MTETTESRLFKILVFIGSGFFTGFSLANIIYYNKARAFAARNPTSPLSHGEATSMLWVNVFLFIFSLILFIWSIWRLLFHREHRTQITQNIGTYLQSPATGIVRRSPAVRANGGNGRVQVAV